MKLRKILAAFLAGAVAMSSMVFSAGAAEEEAATPLNDTGVEENNNVISEDGVLSLGAPSDSPSASYDADTGTITYTTAWGFIHWELFCNCSEYSKVVIKYSDSTLGSIAADVIYSDGTHDRQESTSASGVITIDLNDALKSKVYYVQIGGSNTAGSLKIISAEFIPEEASDVEENDDVINEDGVLNIGAPDDGWGSTFDNATDTITFEGAYSGSSWTLHKDYSEYSKFILKYSDSTVGAVTLKIMYSDGTTETHQSEAVNGELVIELDDAKKSNIAQLSIMSNKPGTLKLVSAEFFPEEASDVEENDDVINGDGVLNIGAPDDGWGSTFDDATDTITFEGAWVGSTWILNKDYSEYSKFILKYSDSTVGTVILGITYGDGTKEIQRSEAVNGEIVVELDDAKKSNIGQLSIMNEKPGTLKLVSAEFFPIPNFNKTAAEFKAENAGKIITQTSYSMDAKRFTMLFSLDAIQNAENAVFTLNNGTTTKTYTTKWYYKSLTASGTKVSAPEGYGFVTLTITDIPDDVTVTCEKIELTIKA